MNILNVWTFETFFLGHPVCTRQKCSSKIFENRRRKIQNNLLSPPRSCRWLLKEMRSTQVTHFDTFHITISKLYTLQCFAIKKHAIIGPGCTIHGVKINYYWKNSNDSATDFVSQWCPFAEKMNQSEAWEMHGPRGARRWYISNVGCKLFWLIWKHSIDRDMMVMVMGLHCH